MGICISSLLFCLSIQSPRLNGCRNSATADPAAAMPVCCLKACQQQTPCGSHSCSKGDVLCQTHACVAATDLCITSTACRCMSYHLNIPCGTYIGQAVLPEHNADFLSTFTRGCKFIICMLFCQSSFQLTLLLIVLHILLCSCVCPAILLRLS